MLNVLLTLFQIDCGSGGVQTQNYENYLWTQLYCLRVDKATKGVELLKCKKYIVKHFLQSFTAESPSETHFETSLLEKTNLKH